MAQGLRSLWPFSFQGTGGYIGESDLGALWLLREARLAPAEPRILQGSEQGGAGTGSGKAKGRESSRA